MIARNASSISTLIIRTPVSINQIVIGPRSNIQDNAVVHLADDFGCHIGELVTVGHSAVVHACTHWDDPEEVLNASRGLGSAMEGLEMETLDESERLANRGW